MKVILIVGRRKAGKTTLAKKLAKGLARSLVKLGHRAPLKVYDTTAQWGAPFETWEAFKARMLNARNSIVVIEEATVNLDARHYSSEVQEAFIASRHHRNTFILLFHSLASVPAYIMALTDTVYLFTTNDAPERVRRSFGTWPKIFEAWQDLDGAPPFTFKRIDLNG